MSATYPNFPEYKLKSVYKGETFFKRGATRDHIFHEEFEEWQKFFCSGSTFRQPEKTSLYSMSAHGQNHMTFPILEKNKGGYK